ncbi:MAG: chemotaxis protein CheW [Clostridium sp.]|uniref:chemotaxis protein CheW n=1 Tax=Clostridium sp. TaxID=1506 RepID=UPI003EE77D80
MQVVVFKAGEKWFGIDAKNVKSINKVISVTKIPNAPKYIKGLINIKGSIKTLVDINVLLEIDYVECKENIIILDIKDEEIGILVSKVEEIIPFTSKELKTIEVRESYIKEFIGYKEDKLILIEVKELLEWFNLRKILK